MVSFDQHIVFPAGFQLYIGILILALFLLVVTVLLVSIRIHQLSIAIRMQSEISGVGHCAQARKMGGKKD